MAYCFAAKSRDAAGNGSGFGANRCTVLPVRDRTLAASSGWTRRSGSGTYYGTWTETKRLNATLTLASVKARHISLVVTRCSGCGTVNVYIGSTLLKRISLAAPSTRKKQLVSIYASGTLKTGTVKVKVVSSGKLVRIEGLGATFL